MRIEKAKKVILATLPVLFSFLLANQSVYAAPSEKRRHIPSHIITLEIDGEEYLIDLKKSSACGL